MTSLTILRTGAGSLPSPPVIDGFRALGCRVVAADADPLSVGFTGADASAVIPYAKDEEFATEQGAYGCAILVVEELAGLRVTARSRKGTGFDWWLGSDKNDDDEKLFQQKTRLEVSGIRKGPHRVKTRVKDKKEQTKQSDHMSLEALVVVVEFSLPLTQVEKRS